MATAQEKDEKAKSAARLKLARERAKFSGPVPAAKHFRWNPNTYKKHEGGGNGFGVTDAKKYANAYGVSLQWLRFGIGSPEDEDPPDDAIQVDVLSHVTAGRLASENAVLLPDDIIRTIVVSGLGPGDWAALVIDGTSMDRLAPDGSTLIFNRSQTTLIEGSFYVFRDPYSGDATFKQWASQPPRLRPYSNSTEHDTIYLDNVPSVLGKARRVLIDL